MTLLHQGDARKLRRAASGLELTSRQDASEKLPFIRLPRFEGAVMVERITFSEHDGIRRASFRCPGCELFHALPVDGDIPDGMPRWTFTGGADRPSFRPSILSRLYLQGRTEVCHSFVTEGRIRFLDDCTHSKAGETLDLPPAS